MTILDEFKTALGHDVTYNNFVDGVGADDAATFVNGFSDVADAATFVSGVGADNAATFVNYAGRV